MDVHMPIMEGPEATMIIRKSGTPNANIPIIAITADAMKEHLPRYFRAGMNAVTTKPIKLSHLLSTISEVMHVPADSEENLVKTLPDEISQQSLGNEEKFSELRNLVGDATVIELIQQAPISLKDSFVSLKSGINSGNSDEIRSAAHAIKGMSASLCALRLPEVAGEMELNSKDIKKASALMPDLERIAEDTVTWWNDVGNIEYRNSA
jgi:CheY-like chemotaxis protein